MATKWERLPTYGEAPLISTQAFGDCALKAFYISTRMALGLRTPVLNRPYFGKKNLQPLAEDFNPVGE